MSMKSILIYVAVGVGAIVLYSKVDAVKSLFAKVGL
jgi:hypothetical protein